MTDYPNRDYEPGPAGTSFSRMGPPPAPANSQTPGHTRATMYEFAGEVGVQPQRAASARRGTRRRYKRYFM